MTEAEKTSEAPAIVKPLKRLGAQRLVVASCALGLFAMGLMCWSVLDPTPFPVMVAMSIGQVVGTLSLACYLLAVLLHARTERSEKKR